MRRISLWLSLALMAPVSVAAQGTAEPPRPLTAAPFRGGTAGDLAELCAAAPEDASRVLAIGYCHGLLIGVAQMHRIAAARDSRARPTFCLPDPPPNLSTVAAQYVSWFRTQPASGGETAAAALLRFAADTYPCARPGTPPSRPRR